MTKVPMPREDSANHSKYLLPLAAVLTAALVSAVLVWSSTDRGARADEERVVRRATARHDAKPMSMDAHPAWEGLTPLGLLLYHLRHGDYDKRREAIAAIEAMGARGVDAIPTLTELLADEGDGWGNMRASLARTLAGLLPDSADAIRSLATHETEAGRMGAARVIGFAGTGMSGALELLTPLAFDKASVRTEAMFALAELGPAGAELLARASVTVSKQFFDRSALSRAGRHVVPALARRLSDADPVVRERAAVALRSTGRDLRVATDELRIALADESLELRAKLIRAVHLAGISELLSADLLHSMLIHGVLRDRFSAVSLLRNVDIRPDEAAVEHMVALMSDSDGSRRAAAAEQLVDHPRHGGEAIELLWKEALAGNHQAQRGFKRLSGRLDIEEWLPRYLEAIENSPERGYAARLMFAIGDRGLEALLPITDRLPEWLQRGFANELLASTRHRRAGVELANRILPTPSGFFLLASGGARRVSFDGLQPGLRAAIRAAHYGSTLAIETLVELEGKRCLPLLREIAADPKHRLSGRAKGLIESIGAEKKVPPAVELDELRKKVAGHALYKRWRAALEIHELFGDWSAAHTMLDENMRSGRELEQLTRRLAGMKGNRADALADLERLLEHPDDCVREAAVACVAKWGEDALSLHARIEALASENEPDADVRFAARAILE